MVSSIVYYARYPYSTGRPLISIGITSDQLLNRIEDLYDGFHLRSRSNGLNTAKFSQADA